MAENNENRTELKIGEKITFRKVDEIVEQFQSAQSPWIQLAVLVSKTLTTYFWVSGLVEIIKNLSLL